jgi:topoisomerase-4 subunit A
MKRFAVTSITRDKEYTITKGTAGSRVLYFTANPNGEAEVVKVFLKPRPNLKKLIFELDFSKLSIKGRQSQGNILTKHDVHKIVLKEKGISTLGGRNIWYDEAVKRLNVDHRGTYLGEFLGEDKILVISKEGKYRITTFELTNHFPEDILLIEKLEKEKLYSAVHFDGEQGQYYLKRFEIDADDKETLIISEHPKSKLVDIAYDRKPILEVIFGGKDADKKPEIINVEEFIAVKGATARGKRISTNKIKKFNWLEPIPVPEEENKKEIKTNSIEESEGNNNKKESPIKDIEDTTQLTIEI